MDPEIAAALLGHVLAWPIVLWDENQRLRALALDLAARFERPNAYDAQYLAVADMIGCELWTGDKLLVNAVGGRLPWLRYVWEEK